MRWVNPRHPQTLNIGVILLYIDAVFMLLGGAIASGIGLLLAAASIGAGVGIANDKRVAWYVGIVVSAIVPLFIARSIWTNGFDTLFDPAFLINAVFPIAQLVALVHPMSRSFVRIWFE